MTCLRMRASLIALPLLWLLLAGCSGNTSRGGVARTPWGDPDLEGTWNNATLTPLQRPPALASKEFFTSDEAAAYIKDRLEQSNVDRRPQASGAAPNVGTYNDLFFEREPKVVKSLRTSLVIDPKDGRIPQLVPEAQARLDAARQRLALHPADGPEDRSLLERCLLFSAGGPAMLPEGYNSNYQIVQTPRYVVVLIEMIHDVRIIPLDGRAHLPANASTWLGGSRGHWENDTLVVETTNLRSTSRGRSGIGMSDEHLRVVERFTRSDATTIAYRATVEDPTVYTTPWTIEISLDRAKGPILEYACHEGNYGLAGILSGARAEENEAGTRGKVR
ncbi:MAG: hypothetical protein ABL986_15000 [Vicinamibacterales bacterium]